MVLTTVSIILRHLAVSKVEEVHLSQTVWCSPYGSTPWCLRLQSRDNTCGERGTVYSVGLLSNKP